MNAIFTVVIIISIAILTIKSPNQVLSSFISGGEDALSLCSKLFVIYAVWLGLFEILERTKLSNKLTRCISPFNSLLFGKLDSKAEGYISLNLSANIFGFSGATTPMGIASIKELTKHKNTGYQIAMFFVLNATSIQLIPSSVLALRSTFNSANVSSIILPTFLSTLVSTILGILMVKVFVKKDC